MSMTTLLILNLGDLYIYYCGFPAMKYSILTKIGYYDTFPKEESELESLFLIRPRVQYGVTMSLGESPTRADGRIRACHAQGTTEETSAWKEPGQPRAQAG